MKREVVWHHFDDTDEYLPVLKGRITIRLREGASAASEHPVVARAGAAGS
jgi:hypothetical protein